MKFLFWLIKQFQVQFTFSEGHILILVAQTKTKEGEQQEPQKSSGGRKAGKKEEQE